MPIYTHPVTNRRIEYQVDNFDHTGYICISEVNDLDILLENNNIEYLHVRGAEDIKIDKFLEKLTDLKRENMDWATPVALIFDNVRLSLSHDAMAAPPPQPKRHFHRLFNKGSHDDSFKISHVQFNKCSPEAFAYIVRYCNMKSFGVNILDRENNVSNIVFDYCILSNEKLSGTIRHEQIGGGSSTCTSGSSVSDIRKCIYAMATFHNRHLFFGKGDDRGCLLVHAIFSKLTDNATSILSDYFKEPMPSSTGESDKNELLSPLLQSLLDEAKINILRANGSNLRALVELAKMWWSKQ